MGGKRRRRRVEPTDRWEQIELPCVWPEQARYEAIRHQGPEDGPHAALDLAGRGSGEVLHWQVDLPKAVPFEAGLLGGPLVEVEQQPLAESAAMARSVRG